MTKGADIFHCSWILRDGTWTSLLVLFLTLTPSISSLTVSSSVSLGQLQSSQSSLAPPVPPDTMAISTASQLSLLPRAFPSTMAAAVTSQISQSSLVPPVSSSTMDASTAGQMSQSSFASLSPSTTATTIVRSSSHPALPSQSPLPHVSCRTGPNFVKRSNQLSVTDHIYLDLFEPVNCSGVITRWYYCHIVIGFRNSSAGLWPCVWRQSNDSNELENVGCHKFTIVPGDGSDVRCRYYIPNNPSQLLRVEEGDYIGFYIPDSGLFLALSELKYDQGHYQLQRNHSGFSSHIKISELFPVSTASGRALLSAEIGKLLVIFLSSLHGFLSLGISYMQLIFTIHLC